MATSMDRLERNFDRLEKFFKKRKPILHRESIMLPSQRSRSPTFRSDSFELNSQTFPSPSFLRPTSTRMFARDEVIPLESKSRRAKSLPESSTLSERRLSHEHSPASYSNILDQFPKIPQRSSSLRQNPMHPSGRRPRSGTASLAELLNSDVPEDLTMGSDKFVGSSRLHLWLRRRSNSPRPSAESQVDEAPEVLAPEPVRNLDTPPPSAREESFPSPAHVDRDSKQHSPAMAPHAHGNPTPGPSPVLRPSTQDEPKPLTANQKASASRPKSLDNDADGAPKVTMASLRKIVSDSTLAASSSLWKGEEDLKEPSLKDFMSLSDDDIADETADEVTSDATNGAADDQATPATTTKLHLRRPSSPPGCSLPPDPPQPATPRKGATGRMPVPLGLPSAVRPPATVAAFEAARIAARYQFDLVYVVNLWPSHTGCSQPRATSSQFPVPYFDVPARVAPSLATPTNSLRSLAALHKCLEGQGSIANMNPRSGMNGRLLAAYGLPSVMSPFRISAPVHQKVLRADGWLEYRSDSPAAEEFVRGYSCSFYAGYSPDGRWRPVETDVDKERTGSPEERAKKRQDRPANRGIVFAAYRLPNADGSVLSSTKDELDRLHRDAELFVETLIDIHMMQRQRDLQAEVQAAQAARASARRCVAEDAASQQAGATNPSPAPTPLLAA